MKILLSCFTSLAAIMVGQIPAYAQEFSRRQIFNLEITHQAALSEGAEFSLPLPFSFPDDARNDSIFGADVSHHNFDACRCKADWNKAASQKVIFVYAKATQGDRFQDATFVENWRSLAGTSIYRGAYHFLSADADALEQAKHFVQVIQGAGGLKPNDLPPSLDVEWDIRVVNGKIVLGPDGRPLDHWVNVPPAEIIRKMNTWLSYVESQLHRTPIIYTSQAWWVGRLKDETLMNQFDKYKTWIADYSKSGRGTENPLDFPGHRRSLWQFSDSGSIRDGRESSSDSLSADVSIFAGAADAFKNEFGLK